MSSSQADVLFLSNQCLRLKLWLRADLTTSMCLCTGGGEMHALAEMRQVPRFRKGDPWQWPPLLHNWGHLLSFPELEQSSGDTQRLPEAQEPRNVTLLSQTVGLGACNLPSSARALGPVPAGRLRGVPGVRGPSENCDHQSRRSHTSSSHYSSLAFLIIY